MARLLTESAGDVGVRPLFERRGGQRYEDQTCCDRDYNSPHGGSIAMRRIISIVALGVAAIALGQAAPAITDNVDVTIDQWMTPSKPAYPHDPAVAPDGSIWYTAQRASAIGRFDPATEQFKE